MVLNCREDYQQPYQRPRSGRQRSLSTEIGGKGFDQIGRRDSRGLRLASGLVLHVPNGFFLLKRRSEDSVTSMRLTSTLLISSLLASSPLWAQDGDLKF